MFIHQLHAHSINVFPPPSKKSCIDPWECFRHAAVDNSYKHKSHTKCLVVLSLPCSLEMKRTRGIIAELATRIKDEQLQVAKQSNLGGGGGGGGHQ